MDKGQALLLLLMASFFLYGWYSVGRRGRRDNRYALNRQCKRAAAKLGLVPAGTDPLSWKHAEDGGRLGDLTVSCQPLSEEDRVFLDLVIDGNGAIPRQLTVDAESSETPAFRGADIELEHQDFDQKVRLKGDEVTAVAALDAKARRLIMRHVGRPGGGHTLVADGRIRKWTSPRFFARDLHELMELAEQLVIREEDLAKRLVRNVSREPLVSVRLRNLLLLQRTFPHSDEATEASRHAFASSHLPLRLAGAMHLGEEDLDLLREGVLSDHVDTDLTIKAIECLAKETFAPQAIPILETLAARDDPRTLEGVADGLQRIGDPAGEPCLMRLLRSDHDGVRLAAVRALRAVGTAASVEGLLELAAEGVLQRGLRREAREAIAHIQSRLGDVEAGRLALATPSEQDGGLSLPDAPEQRGALSLETETEEERET